MNRDATKVRWEKSLPGILAVAVVYILIAKASFLLTISPGNISPLFPAAGIALAAALIMGPRSLWGVWAGSFIANLSSFVDGTVPVELFGSHDLLVACLIGLGAVCGAAAGALLVRWLCRGAPPLQGGRNVLILITVGALLCGMISPCFGVFSLALAGHVPWDQFGYAWTTWWVGDASGILVTTPLILAWRQPRAFRFDTWRMLEAIVLLMGILVVCGNVFFRAAPFGYLLLPLLVWAAFRFGMRGAATAAAAIAVLAAVGTSLGRSSFSGNTVNESLLLLNSFLGVTITCALCMAGVISERQRAEATLRESEERLRHLGDNLPDSYVYQYFFDADGLPHFYYVSAGAERLHGVSAEEAMRDARLLLGQISAEQLPQMRAAEAASLREMKDFEMELRINRADGQWRWLQVRSRPRHRADGEVIWYGVATDITERKRMEAALSEKEQKYREVVEYANSIILRWNAEGQITFLNEYGLRFFGYTAEEVFARPVIGTIVPPTETGGRDLRQLMAEICANPKAFEQNVNQNMRRNGELVWVSWTNRIVQDEAGTVIEILSVGTDITERRHAEEALRQSEEQFRLIMENLSDLVALLDLEGRRLYNSPSYGRILGDIGRLRGSLSFDQVHPEDAERVRRAFQDTVRTGEGHRLEYRLMAGDGEPRFIESQGSAIRDAYGRVAQVVVVSRDITARRQAEEELRRLHEELQHYAKDLERRVAARTAELAVARDRAEAADRTKSAFLASMSHELRTPLNSIIGFTGILLQQLAGPLNPEQAKQLEMVRSSARHLLALINDVLDISKIEAGQLEVFHAPFSLRSAIEKTTSMVRPLAVGKHLELRITVAPEVGNIVSDQRRVEQVLLNLLNNAIKFTQRGHVALQAVRRDDAFFQISITDTGIGIKPADQTKLFQPFRQVDTGLSRQHEGTGLGLAICRRLVERLGGEIAVASAWGQGSTFTFTLPAGIIEDKP